MNTSKGAVIIRLIGCNGGFLVLITRRGSGVAVGVGVTIVGLSVAVGSDTWDCCTEPVGFGCAVGITDVGVTVIRVVGAGVWLVSIVGLVVGSGGKVGVSV